MKNKSLTARIITTLLVISACISGYLGICLSLDSPDITLWLGVGIGFAVIGTVGNIVIWTWGTRK